MVVITGNPLTNGNECDITSCLGQRSISNVQSIPCPELKSMHQCLKSYKLSCRGNLQVFALITMIKSMKSTKCPERNHRKKRPMIHESYGMRPTRHNSQQHQVVQPSTSPSLRTGDSNVVLQQIGKISKNRARFDDPYDEGTVMKITSTINHQYCLPAAYNFTIGMKIVSNIQFSIASKTFSSMIANPEEQLDRTFTFTQPLSSQQQPTARLGKKVRKERTRRDTSDSSYVRTANDAVRSYLQQSNEPEFKDSNLKHEPSLSSMPNKPQQSEPAKVTELVYKPIQPPTPSLTCIIFGDPHIRTFDSRYQTCNCLGARSLIEHPLFDVQITNSRINGKLISSMFVICYMV